MIRQKTKQYESLCNFVSKEFWKRNMHDKIFLSLINSSTSISQTYQLNTNFLFKEIFWGRILERRNKFHAKRNKVLFPKRINILKDSLGLSLDLPLECLWNLSIFAMILSVIQSCFYSWEEIYWKEILEKVSLKRLKQE